MDESYIVITIMVVFPGDILESDGLSHKVGDGVYLHEIGPRSALIRASVVGMVRVEAHANGIKEYSVVPYGNNSEKNFKLDVDDYVLARATKAMQAQVGVDIIATGEGEKMLNFQPKGGVRLHQSKTWIECLSATAHSFAIGERENSRGWLDYPPPMRRYLRRQLSPQKLRLGDCVPFLRQKKFSSHWMHTQ